MPVHERMQEQGTRQPVFQAARHMTRLILQVEPNPRKRGKRDRKEVRIGGSAEIRLDLPAGLREPLPISHATAPAACGNSRGTVKVKVDPTPSALLTETSPPRMRANRR